jgi:hypothetical protein
MFFRRRLPREVTFEQRVEGLRSSGFESRTLQGGRVWVQKSGCAAVLERSPEGEPRVVRLGVLIGDEIAALIDGGYQKFLETPSGKLRPALARELKALHDFQEDLHEALGLTSLYNQSLGTVCDRHSYDRLAGRPQA